MKITNFKKKKIKLLTKEQQKSYENTKIYYICKEKFEDKYAKGKKYQKVRDHYHYAVEYRGAAHIICNFKYSIPKKITMVFLSGSSYDCHFIIKELAEKFKVQYTCLGENTEKYITFSVPIDKGIKRNGTNGEEITKTISNRLQFIDSAGFMATSLSNLVNNIAEGNHKVKCKYGDNNEKRETCGIKYENCECYFEYTSVKDNLILTNFLTMISIS